MHLSAFPRTSGQHQSQLVTATFCFVGSVGAAMRFVFWIGGWIGPLLTTSILDVVFFSGPPNCCFCSGQPVTVDRSVVTKENSELPYNQQKQKQTLDLL